MAINTLSGRVNTLFDLATVPPSIEKANEGVAMALAMESPSLPDGATVAIGGGVGYCNNRTAVTADFSARVARCRPFSAGVVRGQ